MSFITQYISKSTMIKKIKAYIQNKGTTGSHF